MTDMPRQRLLAGVAALELDLDADRLEAMLAFVSLLARWNQAYNLTAIDDPNAMVDRHLLDSLSILPWLRSDRVLDAGTGAGLPGIPLAIASPQRYFVLVDANGKKVRFLRQVRRELALDNIEPVHARLESLDPVSHPAGDLVARALAPLPRLIEQLQPYLDRGARLLAMKGRLEQSECDGLPSAYNVERIELRVPGTAAERCLAIVNRNE
ncbi:16S rRNA (guanine(527)-N(7))-methyltransferase RsmG [Wenzhouxiangella sp. AB-CW3]|uniref:16S rRNA (guanine(527)-N(7))-methyltransferase RsmG n=1 Tax=Wenzhouxiangella sp. AB-CW3 TaxID=2771012 RepID=UPI00168A9EE1|nr:16S rRNA (guanine(527)-N(7))-methyltransferase RsmG [Wenzhouxiangella sp. AB-CW3]QOC22675.1 16S rRNA (guanine(527)-N(7))-methyltransferase RsmG [Wenzhouxiangella sp. AB-CW3]